MSQFIIRIFDVEHGACAIMAASPGDRIAMIDSGHNSTTGWRPSTYIRSVLQRNSLDYLFVTNADQDHLSDLDGLWEHQIDVKILYRNLSPDAQNLRIIKENQCELTNDIERYLKIHASYTAPVPIPFDVGMGGAICSTFSNKFPTFRDTNNLSMVVFIKFGGFKILFPGDLEDKGWKKLLEVPAFVTELANTDVLVASHHGRLNGFCEEIFNFFSPQAVVISDKPVVHTTQEIVPDYRQVIQDGVIVSNQTKRRHVLTTRRDGDITFAISNDGSFNITTSKS